MRKSLAVLAMGTFLFTACNKNDKAKQDSITPNETPTVLSKRDCGSMEVLKEQLAEDPTLQKRMDEIENFTNQLLSSPQKYVLLADGTIQIPVVVNVLYRTSAENISDAQIQSQIDVLNEDFATTNADYSNVPSLFQSVRSGKIGVSFVLDKIVRKSTTKTSWATNDGMKKTSSGGIAPTSPTTKLNIWVCTMSGGILGYAQFPGGASSTDGVVILNTAMGRVGTAAAPFNKGRTATHEVGHWMNLHHIWGDATCGSDLVGDTPLHTSSNYGCPGFPTQSTCSGSPTMMTMNYMDYTDDACMYMFSAGQKARMLAVFAVGGSRASFR